MWPNFIRSICGRYCYKSTSSSVDSLRGYSQPRAVTFALLKATLKVGLTRQPLDTISNLRWGNFSASNWYALNARYKKITKSLHGEKKHASSVHFRFSNVFLLSHLIIFMRFSDVTVTTFIYYFLRGCRRSR